jgi:hypothetical protein
MEATQVTTQMTRCGSPLPELEVPMINTMVTCLGSEHRKLDDHILQLAFAATTLASEPDALTANHGTLKIERQEMRKLVAALPALSSGVGSEPQTARDRGGFARTLLALARTLDSHVECYDGEVLPSILRALFRR